MTFTAIGLDPGKTGGIAWVTDGVPQAMKMPETTADIVEALTYFDPANSFVVIERVQAMPAHVQGRRQGISSAFKFGYGAGVLEGVVASVKLPHEFVGPSRWQQAMKCRTGGDKNVSKRRAQQLFPSLKITHAVADALLIARYCWERHKDH